MANTVYVLEEEVALGLPQLGLRFFADNNSWNLKPQNCEEDA